MLAVVLLLLLVLLASPETAETLVGVDINERNAALTALDRETMRTKGTLVLDYGRVKQERQRYHTITTRCQEHSKTSVHRKIGDKEERFIEKSLKIRTRGRNCRRTVVNTQLKCCP